MRPAALPVPCLPDTGMDLNVLRDALDQTHVKAVVTIANANNPVGSVAPDLAKAALVRLLRERDIPLIEDDIFGDVSFGEVRPRPARAFDAEGNVLLCGGVSKSLCPGLRLGWIAAGRFAERVKAKALKCTTSMVTANCNRSQLRKCSRAAATRYTSGDSRQPSSTSNGICVTRCCAISRLAPR